MALKKTKKRAAKSKKSGTGKAVAVNKKVVLQRRKPNMALAVVGLVLNLLILPGLGSLIGGRVKTGIWQIILALIGAILLYFYVGIPILVFAWIWGIVTGVRMIQAAS